MFKSSVSTALGLFLAAGLFPCSLRAEARDASHLLGPGDSVSVHVLHATEISDKPVRVDEGGFIRLPLAGKVHVGGLTVDQAAAELRSRLSSVIRDPEVSVDVVEFRSHPVSVLGAVKQPGVFQIQGPKRLLEVLSLAGGVEPDAGYSIRISRHKSMGAIPLPVSGVRDSGDYSIGEVSLGALIDGRNPEQNIVIVPQDVVSVPRAKLVYVIGEVRRSGGFVLKESESISVLQALSLAEGLTPVASSGARVMRGPRSGAKTEIPINVKKILAGKSPDVPLLPEDVLIIPKSGAKSVAIRSAEAAISMGTGVVVWRR